MIFLLITIFIAAAVVIFYTMDMKVKKDRTFLDPANMVVIKIWLVVIFMVPIGLPSIARIVTYDNYVDLKKFYYATVEQYREAVEMYEDKAVLNVERAALVDFQYKGYQDNVASFIKDLRKKVVIYNENLISKREYKSNMFFWPMVHYPDDSGLKIISLKKGGGSGSADPKVRLLMPRVQLQKSH